LVPLACVLAALLYAKVRERSPRTLWVDLTAAVLPVVLFAPALVSYIRHEIKLEDSREQAILWLEDHASPRDRILPAQERAILPSRIAAVDAGETDVKQWALARERIRTRRFHYLVLGELTRPRGGMKIRPRVRDWILANYTVAASFGGYPTRPDGRAFNGNG